MENENNNKVVYNSISDLVNKEPEVEEKAKIASNTKSEDLQIISNLETIAPAIDHDDKMKTDDTAFWKEINDDLNKSLYDTDRLLREAVEKKELEKADKEDEKILNGDYSEDYIEENTTPEEDKIDSWYEYEEEKEEYVPKKIYSKQSPKVEEEPTLFVDDEDDFSDEDLEELNDDLDEEEDKKFIKDIQSSIKDKIKTVSKPVDISTFKISNKRVSANKVLKADEKDMGRVITWVLYNSGKTIRMREFKGYEIEQLNTNNLNGRTQFKMYQDIFKIIYNHVVDEDKVPFEVWLKSIKFTDLNDLYFAIYQACFSGSNSIPYSCPNKSCENVFMRDVPIEDMVKYSSKEVEERVHELLNGEYTIDGTEDIEIIMISDKYAVGLRKPSLYNVYFEMGLIDDSFREKYASFIRFMSYIDELYVVDRQNNDLIPIDVSISDYKNTTKAVKNKIMQYSKILRTLTTDQFSAFQSYVFNIDQDLVKIEYQIPEAECPKCHTKIPTDGSSPERMIFLRQQLLLLANSSIN